jgi:hypothetical protein
MYTMEYYTAIRNNDMWFEEISQDQKHKATYFLSYVEDRSKDKHKHKTSMITYKLRYRT